jgi:hypothetical protein
MNPFDCVIANLGIGSLLSKAHFVGPDQAGNSIWSSKQGNELANALNAPRIHAFRLPGLKNHAGQGFAGASHERLKLAFMPQAKLSRIRWKAHAFIGRRAISGDNQ